MENYKIAFLPSLRSGARILCQFWGFKRVYADPRGPGILWSSSRVHMFISCSRSFQNIWIDEPAESISLDQFTEELDPLMYVVLSRNEEGGTCSDGFYRWHGFVMVFNLNELDL